MFFRGKLYSKNETLFCQGNMYISLTVPFLHEINYFKVRRPKTFKSLRNGKFQVNCCLQSKSWMIVFDINFSGTFEKSSEVDALSVSVNFKLMWRHYTQ